MGGELPKPDLISEGASKNDCKHAEYTHEACTEFCLPFGVQMSSVMKILADRPWRKILCIPIGIRTRVLYDKLEITVFFIIKYIILFLHLQL